MIVIILAITVAVSLLSPKGKALRALQNAERYAFRYSRLAEDTDVSDADRVQAEQLMDDWTRKAESVAPRYREELLEHKDKYSDIIRTAHETRLASARAAGREAGESEKIVKQRGPTV